MHKQLLNQLDHMIDEHERYISKLCREKQEINKWLYDIRGICEKKNLTDEERIAKIKEIVVGITPHGPNWSTS